MKISGIAISLLACVTLAACTGAGVAVPTAQTPAGQVSPESNQEATETPTLPPTFTPTLTPEPTATNTRVPIATATPSPTPEPEPVVKVDETLSTQVNVRAGPGTNYPVVTQFEPGQEAAVTGRNEDSGWWQVSIDEAGQPNESGWIFGELVTLSGNGSQIPVAQAPPPPATPTPAPEAVAETETESSTGEETADEAGGDPPAEELAEQLRCGKDFCVTYQAMVPIWENGGCVGNHSIYITVLQGLPPGKPMDGVVIGDTFNNVEVASGSHGPGRTEITLWSNSMTLVAKRHIDGTPYTSEESFNFTAHDELIPAEVLAAAGYCGGSAEQCRHAQQNNQVCRGHYSWRVTFHKFD